ncbi:hypothetical protein PaG_02192 [Moesziomyces aphidis]|uniref:Uncharacterized protein n=1 Tax=Moesziomyces aphidis TaxID=84754 RepID=W3VQY1_MOEAP|nr:hypothetical protein PaG_02192 [Moesziomyces aphidis]
MQWRGRCQTAIPSGTAEAPLDREELRIKSHMGRFSHPLRSFPASPGEPGRGLAPEQVSLTDADYGLRGGEPEGYSSAEFGSIPASAHRRVSLPGSVSLRYAKSIQAKRAQDDRLCRPGTKAHLDPDPSVQSVGCTDQTARQGRAATAAARLSDGVTLSLRLEHHNAVHMFSAEIFETSPWARLMDSTDVPESHRQ